LPALPVVVAVIALRTGYVGPKNFTQVGQTAHSLAKAQVDSLARALGRPAS
jgi:hypothetical protein